MPDSSHTPSVPEKPLVYQIRIAGHLSPQLNAWFGDVTMTTNDSGETVLTCPVADQAGLYALLRRVRDLGAPLLSITRLDAGHTPLQPVADQIRFVSPLQVELFVRDVDASRHFYSHVLGFSAGPRQEGDYSPLSNGPVRLALNALSGLPHDHPVALASGERPGRGVEFVLRVDDIRAAYERVQRAGWPISGELQRQPCGLEDFRVQDPDGNYLRITSRH